MTTEELVNQIAAERKKWDKKVPSPAAAQQIATLAATFERRFKRPLPEAYTALLRLSDGVYFNGLKIWPTTKGGLFRESLVEANLDLRETFSDEYLFFGQRDEELYVLDLKSGQFKAIEFVGKPTWMTFDNAEHMIDFMLKRALGIAEETNVR